MALTLLSCLQAWGQSEARKLVEANWAVNATPSVAAADFSKEGVAYFRSLLGRSYGRNELAPDVYEVTIPDLSWDLVARASKIKGALGTVGDYKWIDIDADGMYELLEVTDASGRAFYNTLTVVKRIGGGFRFQPIWIWSAPKITESFGDLQTSARGSWSICENGCEVIVTDLDQDGSMELILPVGIGHSRAGAPFPLWTTIFRWEEFRYVQAEERFRSFYETVLLPKVEQKITELSRGKDESQQDRDEALGVEWVVRDKILRLLRGGPNVGLERAIRWAKHPNPNVRLNALAEFGEIPGEESLRYLEMLAKDDDTNVHTYAERLIRERKK